MNKRSIIYICVALMFAACTSDEEEQVQPQSGVLNLTTSVNAFDGETVTRTNLEGNAFANGDRIKIKIICPYSTRTEFGETTYGYTFDALWLLKWNKTQDKWTNLTWKDEVDMAGTYEWKGSYDLFGRYEAQQTPYIYTASTWSDNVIFLSNGSMYSQYSYIFEANQTTERNYLKSDLLWAQSYMQTGSYNVHLSFNHVMACLKISITGGGIDKGNAVVTLAGMPDIDQREVVVGDYYAAKSKVNSKYGYKEKCSCTKKQNGKVLGVAIIKDAIVKAVVHPMRGNPKADGTPLVGEGLVEGEDYVANDGVYTAHYDNGYYYLIVPPCVLTDSPVFWIRDGEKRYSYTLQQTTFEQGKQYAVTITLQ